MIEKIKEKMHIIVMTIIIIYLVALGIKTGHLVYTEYFKKKENTETAQRVETPKNQSAPQQSDIKVKK